MILYDSPTGGLDPVTSTTIIELVMKQRDVYRTPSIMVTHRLQDAFTLCTHRFDTEQGHMVPLPEGETDPNTTFLMLDQERIDLRRLAARTCCTRTMRLCGSFWSKAIGLQGWQICEPCGGALIGRLRCLPMVLPTPHRGRCTALRARLPPTEILALSWHRTST